MLRVFGYLKSHNRARIQFDPSDPSLEDFEFVDNDWGSLYADAEEAIDPNAPEPLSDKELHVLLFVDASHASDLDTRRSVSSHWLFMGRTLLTAYSKRQNTIESATYGSELVSFRLAVDKAVAARADLRALGMKVSKPAVILCDSQSVVANMQLPSSSLKKKHLSVAFHRGREAQAMNITRTGKVDSEWNISDLGTKPKGPQDCYRLLKSPFYGKKADDDGDESSLTDEVGES